MNSSKGRILTNDLIFTPVDECRELMMTFEHIL